ncbi:MAG: OmpA family protein, partial [Pseudomonadota bacterium]
LVVMPMDDVRAQSVCSASDTGGFDDCWYGGFGLGITHVDPEGQAGGWSTNDDSDSGWKGFVGWQFAPRWSLELTYTDGGEAGLGNVDPALEALIPDASIDYRTPSLMVARWLNDPEAKWNAFARLGASAIDNDASDSRIPFDKQTDVQLAGGIGGQLRFAERWFVRADIDLFDRDHYYAGIGIGAYLGSRKTSPAPVAAEPIREPTPDPAPLPEPDREPAPAPVVECRNETSVLEGVNFENNSDELTTASINVLSDVIRRLATNDSDTVQILAHTDSNGSAAYNLDLSTRRARSVELFLVSAGIDASRLSSQGLGEARPIADNATAAGRAANRRVELVWSREVCD